MNFLQYENKEITKIAKIFNKNNFKCILVGGAMRDLLLNKTPKDLDFTTDALPQEIMKIFPKNIPTGIKHGTVSIFFNSKIYEVTSFRIEENYSNKRSPDKVYFTNSLQEDVKRRDFTINAICFDPIQNCIIDYYNGQRDLKKGLIKTVENPIDRFQEDALRILRASRFASTLNFEIEKNTLNAMKLRKNNLIFISKERILNEITKAFEGKNPLKAIMILNKIDFFKTFFKTSPNIKLLKRLYLLSAKNKFVKIILLLLIKEKDFKILNTLQIMKFKTKDINLIINLKNILQNEILFKPKLKNIKKLLSVSKENVHDVLELAKITKNSKKINKIQKLVKKQLRKKEPLLIKDLAINGNIVKNYVKENKKVGYILEKLLDKVLENPKLNKKEILINEIKTINQAFSL